MIKKKIIIATGGTGGHVFPAYSLANHLVKKNYNVKIITDNRGLRYLKKYKNLNLIRLPSSPLNKKNKTKFLLSLIIIFFSVIRSLIYLSFNRPTLIFGMGGYSSFPICFAAWILRIKFIIYENNLILGKANKYLIPLAKKIFVSYNDLEGIPKKYNNKICEVGNIIRDEIINFNFVNDETNALNKRNILVLGGSQGAKVFAEELPQIFKKFKNLKIKIKIFQQCQIHQKDQLSNFYRINDLDHEIFDFTDKISEYYSKANLVITRSGASVLGELINVKIPFISIPLPSSADDHQYKNAAFYQRKGYGFLLAEKDIKTKLFELIDTIFKDKSSINKILLKQKQYSDKNIFNILDIEIEKVLNEKN